MPETLQRKVDCEGKQVIEHAQSGAQFGGMAPLNLVPPFLFFFIL